MNKSTPFEMPAKEDTSAIPDKTISHFEGEVLNLQPSLPWKDQLWLDLRVVPSLGMLYLIIFLDRSNIANARIEGLEKSLHMPLNGFNTAIWIFYLPFVLIMIPSNILLTLPKIRPSYYLGTAVFFLGIVAMCQGLTRSYGGLLVCRFLMGCLEGVLPAGASLLLATYYTRKELSVRFAWFYVFSEAGPCFSGLLAYAIEYLNGSGGYEGWRWIFIIEGLMTCVLGVVGAFWIPPFPQTASFLSEPKRAVLLAKLENDGKGESITSIKDISWRKALTDYKTWLLTLLFFCCDMTAASNANFLPTILKQLGWTASTAQVRTIPVWIFGMVCEVAVAMLADRFGYRLAWNMGSLAVALAGWSIQLSYPAAPGVRYFATYLMAGGGFPQFPLLGGCLASNLRGRGYIAVGMALQAGLGNSANFVASNVFITKEAPKYPTGFTAGTAIMAIGIVSSAFTWYVFAMHNKRLEQRRNAGEISQEDTIEHYRLNL